MRPYSEALGVRVVCQICGGPGVAMRPSGMFGVHQNPAICHYYLGQKAKKLADKEKKLAEKEN